MPRATRGSKTTSTGPVLALRAFSRRTARSPALRPISSRVVEIGEMQARGIFVVALHAGALAGDHAGRARKARADIVADEAVRGRQHQAAEPGAGAAAAGIGDARHGECRLLRGQRIFLQLVGGDRRSRRRDRGRATSCASSAGVGEALIRDPRARPSPWRPRARRAPSGRTRPSPKRWRPACRRRPAARHRRSRTLRCPRPCRAGPTRRSSGRARQPRRRHRRRPSCAASTRAATWSVSFAASSVSFIRLILHFSAGWRGHCCTIYCSGPACAMGDVANAPTKPPPGQYVLEARTDPRISRTSQPHQHLAGFAVVPGKIRNGGESSSRQRPADRCGRARSPSFRRPPCWQRPKA